jgi:ArsR family transcriptional regulator, arsenate/arsenite/antimonite-responsive transcriptional repressor
MVFSVSFESSLKLCLGKSALVAFPLFRYLDEYRNNRLHLFLSRFSRTIMQWQDSGGVSYTKLWNMDRSQIEKISRALADGTRLMIFEAISRKKQMHCGEIVSLQGVTPATVSHHLKILNEAGLVECRREGQFVYSRSVPEVVRAYTRALAQMARGTTASRQR